LGYTLYATDRLPDHEITGMSRFHHRVYDAFRLEIEDAHLACFLCKDESSVAEASVGVITSGAIETGGGFGIV